MPLSPRVGKAREKGQRATGTQVSFCTELLGDSKPGTEGIFGGHPALPSSPYHLGCSWRRDGLIISGYAISIRPRTKGKGLHPGGRRAAPGG